MDLPTGRFAVADGAGNSFFPALWADLLAQRFCTATLGDVEALLSRQHWYSWLKPIRERWRHEVARAVGRIDENERFLFQNRLKQGDFAGAAFVGLWLPPDEVRWAAVTVGDSCLFHIRGQRLLRSFPMQHPDQFSARTEAIVSIAGSDEAQGQVITDELRPGDTFLLATDALSKWLLTRRTEGTQAWTEALERLLQVRSSADLDAFVVEQQRAGRPVDHDDVTVVAVSIGEPAVRASIPSQAAPLSWFEALPESPAPLVDIAAPEQRGAPPQDMYLLTKPRREEGPAPPLAGRLPLIVRRLDKGRAVLLAILAVSLLNLGVSCRQVFNQDDRGQQRDGAEIAVDSQADGFATRAPVPTSQFPVLLLPSAQSLYLTPGAGPVQFLRLERPAEIAYAPESDARWRRVEAFLWVAPESPEVAILNPRGDSLIVKRSIDAWSAPEGWTVASQRVGVIDVQKPFRFDDRTASGGRDWYRLRIPTWIRDDSRSADGS